MSGRRRLSSLPVFLLPRRHLGELSFRWDINLHLLRDRLSAFTRGSPPPGSRGPPRRSATPQRAQPQARAVSQVHARQPGGPRGEPGAERTCGRGRGRQPEVKVHIDFNYSPAWAGAPEGPGTHAGRFHLFVLLGDRVFLKPRSTRALAPSLTQGNCLPLSRVLPPPKFHPREVIAISPFPPALYCSHFSKFTGAPRHLK